MQGEEQRVERQPGAQPFPADFARAQPVAVARDGGKRQIRGHGRKALPVGAERRALAAVDKRCAEDALELVEVDYEPLPAVHDVLLAVEPEAPLVHEQHKPAKAFADLAHVRAGQRSNICYQFKLRTGDVDKAFAEADRVFEDTFSSPPAQHVPMEPHVTLAYLDEHERLNVWTASQSPSYVRTELSLIHI